MQVGFAWLGTWLDSAARQLMGLSSLDIISIGTRRYLIAAGEADGGFTSYEILADGTLRVADDVVFAPGSGTQNVRDVDAFMVGGEAFIVPAGRYDDNLSVFRLDPTGTFTATQSLTSPATLRLTVTEAVSVGGNDYLFTASASGGLARYSLGTGGTLGTPVTIADTPTVALGDVSAMIGANLKGRDFLFVASAFDAGLTVFDIGFNGALTPLTTLTPGLVGFNAISTLATAQIAERAFVLVGSAETDSLLVLRVSAAGQLKLVDSLVDKSETRFARISALEVFEHQGRTFVLAGGSDGGITLLELTYRGRLNVLGTVADEFTTTLSNISDIKVSISGGKILVFVSSASEHGFTEFELTLNPGQTYTGTSAPETIIGSPGDDTIFGMGHSDILDGGAGNDRLVDGRGRDVLTGGPGADVFEFIADGRLDKITDFELGVDKLDLSDYQGLYSFLDLTIRSRPDGAAIIIGDERLWITSADGQPIDPALWTQADFIFG